jgi:hypothetical protein
MQQPPKNAIHWLPPCWVGLGICCWKFDCHWTEIVAENQIEINIKIPTDDGFSKIDRVIVWL